MHVAVIMDGNGRWATRRGLPRSAGHQAGAHAVRRVIEAAPDLGVTSLTLFAFSSDNWRRPREEVSALMALLRHYLRAELRALVECDTRLTVIGRRDRLPAGLSEEIAAAERASAAGRRLNLQIAIDYSSRDSIVTAAAAWRAAFAPTRDAFGRLLAWPSGEPSTDVDLLIRSGGEKRLCGSAPTPSSASSIASGPISPPTTCAPPSPISAAASAASAAYPPSAA